jgi:signal transduction histidine kinase
MSSSIVHSVARGTSVQQPVPAHRECHHEVQFYFDDRFLIRSLANFVREAVDAGRSTIIVATKSHRDSLANELETSGLDLARVLEQGRYVALDAANTLARFMERGVPNEALFNDLLDALLFNSAATAQCSNGKVAIYGEMVSLLWQRGEGEAAIRLEQLWNDLAKRHSFQLRCGYPLASFDQQIHTELFSRICAEHHVVIPAENYTALSDENDRLRTVALLQQTEQVLKTEASGRRIAQEQYQEIQSRNRQLTNEIRKREVVEDELRRFTRRLLTARDEEQRRIAAELHENTAQLLAALSLYFGVLHEEKASLNPRLASVVASSRSVSDSLLSEIRKLSHLLHPPTLDDVGLSSALREYIDQFKGSSDARVDLEIPDDLGRFNRKLEIAVFRIVEEALSSVRPATGLLASVRVTRSVNALVIEIETRNTGNAAAQTATRAEGRITGIHERAIEHGGTVQFKSDQTGTLLGVTFPLGKPAQA